MTIESKHPKQQL